MVREARNAMVCGHFPQVSEPGLVLGVSRQLMARSTL